MTKSHCLENIVLPHKPLGTRWNIQIENHKIKSIKPHNPNTIKQQNQEHSTSASSTSSKATTTSTPSLLIPSLCHPHIHLDKPYLLTSDSNTTTHEKFSLCCSRSPTSPDSSSSSSVPSKSSDNSTQWPDYAQHSPESGTFGEALQLTSKSKQLYTPKDLRLRGAQLLAAAYRQGVSCVRAFVEVDHVTRYMAIEAGLELKRAFEGRLVASTGAKEGGEGMMRIQLVAFAQDPIFSGDYGSENREIMESVLKKYTSLSGPATTNSSGDMITKSGDSEIQELETVIEVLGTTPYVESSNTASLQNIEWAIKTALRYDLHLDFHLDYNLDPDTKPMIWDVVRLLKEYRWAEIQFAKSKAEPISQPAAASPAAEVPSPTQPNRNPEQRSQRKTIVLGHVSHLTLFTSAQLSNLAEQIHSANLTSLLSFVGLPTSDLFMMGRPPAPPSSSSPEGSPSISQDKQQPQIRPRGTLHLPTLHSHSLNAVLGVNNLGNAFTPWGTGDPLALASFCVGVYQIGTPADAEMLFGCVSGGAKRAIGLGFDNGSTAVLEDGGEAKKKKKKKKKKNGGKEGDEECDGYFDKEERAGGVDDAEDDGELVREGRDLSRLEDALLLVRNEEFVDVPELEGLGIRVPAKQRLSIKDAVWDPPEVNLRTLIR